MAKQRTPPMLTATEVADFVYCPKAWKLKRDGEVAESPRLESGEEFHNALGEQVSFAGRVRAFGFAAIIIALVLLLAAMLFR